MRLFFFQFRNLSNDFSPIVQGTSKILAYFNSREIHSQTEKDVLK